jgi:hypothetical protein
MADIFTVAHKLIAEMFFQIEDVACHGTIWPKGHNLASSFGGG